MGEQVPLFDAGDEPHPRGIGRLAEDGVLDRLRLLLAHGDHLVQITEVDARVLRFPAAGLERFLGGLQCGLGPCDSPEVNAEDVAGEHVPARRNFRFRLVFQDMGFLETCRFDHGFSLLCGC